jgi:hypothetical protein
MKTCLEITEEIEKGKVVQNSVKEKVAIRLHLILCKKCNQYSKDSLILDRILKRPRPNSQYNYTQEEKDDLCVKVNAKI